MAEPGGTGEREPEAPGVREAAEDYDVLVVGSGFGGSVTALRLTEKGYRVGVLEAGRRFTRATLPKNSWDLRNYLWAPRLGMYGIQRVYLMSNVLVLAGAGVGGGSLNYANTLYVPPPAFFRDQQWGHLTDWAAELAPYYDQARRMLGVRTNPTTTEADEYLRSVAEELGVGRTFRATPVGVFFGDGADGDGGVRAEPGARVPDPYFGGAGPERAACTECGDCMVGCKIGAKNSLTENYLFLAERAGARIHPMTSVVEIRETGDAHGEGPGGGGFLVTAVPTDRPRRGPRTVLRARHVVLAAGTYGTQSLLHRMKDEGVLPRLSDKLGTLTRTNSEALVGALTTPRRYRRANGGRSADFTRGVAITSSIHPSPTTHIENVRYGKGSNAMALSNMPLYRRHWPKLAALAWEFLRHPVYVSRTLSTYRWSEHAIIGLVMQSADNSLTTFRKRGGLFGRGKLSAEQGHGAPNPVHIPEGWRAARLLAERIDGIAGTNIGEVLGKPMTAHFLGGCTIGESAETSVVDAYHRVHGYPGLSVVDGSAVSANLGVNPSLTITAQAERAMALWPNKGEPDPRPAQGGRYVRLAPVPPASPTVPPGAHGTLLLPVPRVPEAPEASGGVEAPGGPPGGAEATGGSEPSA
ncbi:GMC oxidoreductase [Streptomyces physcomitrii]|uniref:GMC oxidoreductase n=1 Tax=Streptomyces physcomitrii TaxID=2724184 RepID=UPI0035E41037